MKAVALLTAGVATLRIDQSGAQNHLSATADSSGVVALLYRVQDRFNTYLDAKSLCSNKSMKHTEEGHALRETEVTYDYARSKASWKSATSKMVSKRTLRTTFPAA